MARLGGFCSILAGVAYTISGIVYFVYQAGRFDPNSIASINDFFLNVPEAEFTWATVNFSAALASLLAVAGVLALSDRLRPSQEGFVRWASALAIIGYSLSAITNVADFYQIKRIVAGYPQLDFSVKSAVELVGIGSLDPGLILHLATLGTWFLVAGWLALRRGLLPKSLAGSGLIAGIIALASVVISVAELSSLMMLTIILALAFHPIWLLGTGFMLLKEKRLRPALQIV